MKTRRQFLRSTFRGVGLTAIGGLASLLAWRSAHNRCLRINPCDKCSLLDHCDLDQARAAKSPTPSTHGGRTI